MGIFITSASVLNEAESIQTKGITMTRVTATISIVISAVVTFLETGAFFIFIPSLSLLYCYVPTG